MTHLALDDRLTLKRDGWDALCASRDSEFYGGLMTTDALMILVLPLGRETAPAEPSPSPVVSAEPGTVADLDGGNTATVSSVMVLESYPVQFAYVGEVCGPQATDAVWEHRVDDGQWTSEAATTPAQPEEATLRGCEPLELPPLGTFTDGTVV